MENILTHPLTTRRNLLLLAGLMLLAALLVWLLVLRVSASTPAGPSEQARLRFEEETGVRLARIALTAGGGMLDLRYQVLDPDKAVVIHDDEYPPTLIDEASGQAASWPWHAHSSSQELHTAVTYYELLMNPGGLLKRGSAVTVLIGESRLEHVPVQ